MLNYPVKLSAKHIPMGGSYASAMDDIYGIRLNNLLDLLNRPALASLSQKDRATALDQGASMLSQLTSGKRMGDEVARKIEMAQELPANWMDNRHDLVVSQPGRLDHAIVLETHKLLRLSYAADGKKFDIEAEPDLFATVYERLARANGKPASAELVQIGQVIEKRKAEVSGDGQERTSGSGGSDQGTRKKSAKSAPTNRKAVSKD